VQSFHLCRFGPSGCERPGVELDSGRRLDCSSFGEDWGPAFFGTAGLARLSSWLQGAHESLPEIPTGIRTGPCVARPGKLLCIGLNYKDHARETGATLPDEPVVFAKATSAICGPDDNLVIPRGSEQTDWEVELLVVIGARASYVEVADAMQHVAGYAVHNDYSERHWQLQRSGQWVKGKSFDSFAPIGPVMVPAAQVENVHELDLWLSVNGQRRQASNTRELAFDIPQIVSHLSQCMTLEPGDCISTGTPAGVGLGCDPPEFLKPGDRVELGIDGLGTQRQHAVSWEPVR